ncbi:MAG: hypothetical protein GVY10_11250 [Verrucomicrobia bacterium]|jgi:hypothetical protein|nr:hypothetical protein [Verrucomicrobiota bacterium]
MGRALRSPVTLFCTSAGVTAFQLTLMQLFSYVQWYHFAYMMISLALLGFGASGTFLTFGWRFFQSHARGIIGGSLVLAAVAMPGVLLLLNQDWLRFDLYLLFVEPSQWARLILALLLLFLPFFFSALALGGILTGQAADAPRNYFADLAGSSAGALFGIFLTASVMPGHAAAVCGLFPLAGACFFAGRPLRFLALRHAGLLAVLLLLLFPQEWNVSQFKELGRVLEMPRARLVQEETGVRGIVHKVDAPTLHTAPGLSLNYKGPVPAGASVFVDGMQYGSLQGMGVSGPVWEEATTRALGYDLVPEPESVLLLSTEGTSSLRLALAKKAGRILAVEPYPVVAKWLQDEISHLPPGKFPVDLRTLSPRVVLEQAEESFQLIQYPSVGSFHGGVGMQSIGSDFLLTRESFAAAIRLLAEDGVLVVPCWLDFPERKPLRLLTTLLAGARKAGIPSPSDHLAIVRSWGAMSFLFTLNPLTGAQKDTLLRACERWAFDPLWLGGHKDLARERHHQLESRTLFRMTDAILGNPEDPAIAEYPFAIESATDQRPFFSQFLQPRSLAAVEKAFGQRSLPFFELGSFLLLVTLGLLLLFAFAFIFLPLPFHRLRSRGRTTTVLYFAGLGLGFLFVEIIFMQVFHLVWGSPLLAAGGTIAGMLFFSGLGALASRNFDPERPVLPVLFALVCLLLLVAAFTLLPLARSIAPLAPFWRLLIAFTILAIVSFPLGFFFPSGLRLLQRHRPDHLPWAWGINGSFSVISSPLALLACIFAGFPAALLLAMSCYLAAALALLGMRGGTPRVPTQARQGEGWTKG